MSDGLSYTLTPGDVSPFLFQVSRSMGMGPKELAPPMKAFGKYYLGEMPAMFRRSGRGSVRWKGLASTTRANYRAKGIQGAQPLFRTGQIMKSIQTETITSFGLSEQRIFSDYWLAMVHHEGHLFGARTVFPSSKKALRWRSGGKWAFAKKVSIDSFELPARPIVFFTAGDMLKAEQLLRDHITTLVKMGWQRPLMDARNAA